MTKLYRISETVSETNGPLPNYTTSEKDAHYAAVKGKMVYMAEVDWRLMEATVTFAPVKLDRS